MHSEAPAMGPTGERLSHSLAGPSPIGHGTQAPAQLTEVWLTLASEHTLINQPPHPGFS